MAKKYISKIEKGGQTLEIKDAEARAAIEQLDPASAASTQTCEDIIDDIVDGTTKTQGHETEVIPVSGLKSALDKYKNDVTDEGLSGKQDTISDLATIRSGAQAGATAYQKPNGGIPKTDLASAVQTSLGRADTALQEHQDITGKVDKTTTVNGHALSGNVSVTKSDVGLGNVGNFKAVSTVASQGLTDTEKSNARANIGAGTSSFSGSYNDLSNKPTIPAAAKNGTYTVKTLVGSTTTSVSDFTANQSSADDVTFVQGSNVTITPDATNRKITIAAKDTTYSSKTAASGGTDVSLCTTGEKYTWNDKQSKVGKLGSTSKPVYTSAAGTFAECSIYAGGTAVTLNGAGKGGSTASFYAPTSVGTSGQVLVSSGSGAPSWASVASVATCEAIISELT